MAHLSPEMKQRLLALAAEATQRAYAPYSKFYVGCAVLTADDCIFTGCNVENASYGLTICAERNAIFAAVNASGGKPKIMAVAVLTSGTDACSPCGACRQVIAEFGGRECIVVYRSEKGISEKTLGELLPDGFLL